MPIKTNTSCRMVDIKTENLSVGGECVVRTVTGEYDMVYSDGSFRGDDCLVKLLLHG